MYHTCCSVSTAIYDFPPVPGTDHVRLKTPMPGAAGYRLPPVYESRNRPTDTKKNRIMPRFKNRVSNRLPFGITTIAGFQEISRR